MEEKQIETTSGGEAHVDYKDIRQLRNQLNPHARMFNRRRTRFGAKRQRDFARAVKRARFMALVPYIQH